MHPDDDGHDSDTSIASDVSTATTITTRIPYTEAEDVAIIHFLIQSGQLDTVKGNKIWREAADEKRAAPARTWQSLKNRFFANILHNVRDDQYRSLSRDHRRLILRYCGTGRDRKDDGSVSQMVTQNPYLAYLRESELKELRRRRRCRTDSRHSPDISPDESSSSASAADSDLPEKEDVNENVKRNFTDDEDKAVIDYILKRIRWSRKTGDQIKLRGMLFWTTMHKDTRNCRSAHSLRERFLKRILPHLKKFLHIQPVDAAAIRKHAISSKPN